MNGIPTQIGLNEDGTFGPYSRRRCPCCGAPTLAALDASDTSLSDSDGTSSTDCVLCEWESAFADSTSTDVTGDDGLTLVQAQANFDRYHWMYDPTNPRPWMTALPTPEELTARGALRNIYRAIDSETDRERFDALWQEARVAEVNVAGLAELREQAEEMPVDGDSDSLNEELL